jgi:hypothetical protein
MFRILLEPELRAKSVAHSFLCCSVGEQCIPGSGAELCEHKGGAILNGSALYLPILTPAILCACCMLHASNICASAAGAGAAMSHADTLQRVANSE